MNGEHSSCAIKVSSCSTRAAQWLTAGNCGCNAPCCGCWQLPVMCSTACMRQGTTERKVGFGSENWAIWSCLSTSGESIIRHLNKPEEKTDCGKKNKKNKNPAIRNSALLWNIHDTDVSAVLNAQCALSDFFKKDFLSVRNSSTHTCRMRGKVPFEAKAKMCKLRLWCLGNLSLTGAQGKNRNESENGSFQQSHCFFKEAGDPYGQIWFMEFRKVKLRITTRFVE